MKTINDMKTIHMNLSDNSITNLVEIKKLSNASNLTTAMVTALNIAKCILSEQKNGSQIIIKDKKTEYKLEDGFSFS